MKRALKWVGIILGGLLAVIIVAFAGFNVAGAARLQKTHQLTAESIVIPTDDAALARGEHLVLVNCVGCHGADLSGDVMMDDPAMGTIYASNISGVAETHSVDELVLAIRHGVDQDGRQLAIMPAEAFIYFSEEDLGAIIAYLQTVPRAGDDLPTPAMAPVGRFLVGSGLIGAFFPAEYIDHDLPFPARPEIGANAAYGEYIARHCYGCHGSNLAGAQPSDPAAPAAPNLTPGGEMNGWSEADFIVAMRTGVTPSGRQLDPEFMPWESFGKMTDDELRGVWFYLASLPALETNEE